MQMIIKEKMGFTIVGFSGNEIGFKGAKELKESILALVEAGHPNLLLNLEGVSFLDSTAIGTIVTIYKQCVARGGKLRICSLSEDVEMIVYLTGIDRFIEIFRTESEALAYKKPKYFNLDFL